MASLHLLLLLLLFLLLASATSTNPDSHPLLTFKSASTNSSSTLPSWTPTTDPCFATWVGVGCRNGRVARLRLPNFRLLGSIEELTFLPHLRLLNLSRNRLSGQIPAAILSLRRLRRLDLAGNRLSGPIPMEIGLLPKLLTLQLEGNFFSGVIPRSIHGLVDFNVSRNRLGGEIPVSLSSFPASAFYGNWNLCGKPLLLHCAAPAVEGNKPAMIAQKRRMGLVATALSASILALVVLTLAIVSLLLWCRKKKGEEDRTEHNKRGRGEGGEEEEKKMVFFEGSKEFTVEELMRGSAEMLGRGEIGTTYRVVMEGETGGGVVVKRVRRAGREAAAVVARGPMEALLKEVGGVRHPNVVSLRAYCISVDEVLLVYDHIPNGSLHALLHENHGPGKPPLNWTSRLMLASGAAEGLAYLHNMSRKSKLAHQHLTSSNILIDNDGNAQVSDFGVRHLLSPSSKRTTATSVTSQKIDVYCFGIVLLEMLTGRMAGDGDGELSKWVQKVVREEWTSEVFDFELQAEMEAEDEMVALLQVALLCLADAPRDRPKMTMVSRMIDDIKGRGSKRMQGKVSPSPTTLNDLSGDSFTATTMTTPSFSEATVTFSSS